MASSLVLRWLKVFGQGDYSYFIARTVQMKKSLPVNFNPPNSSLRKPKSVRKKNEETEFYNNFITK